MMVPGVEDGDPQEPSEEELGYEPSEVPAEEEAYDAEDELP